MSSQPSPKDEATSYLDDAPTSDESVDGGVALRDGQRASSIDSPSNPVGSSQALGEIRA